MSLRRPAITPAQLRRMLEALSRVGFTPKRVELSPEGGVTLLAEGALDAQPDLLAEWEVSRGQRSH